MVISSACCFRRCGRHRPHPCCKLKSEDVCDVMPHDVRNEANQLAGRTRKHHLERLLRGSTKLARTISKCTSPDPFARAKKMKYCRDISHEGLRKFVTVTGSNKWVAERLASERIKSWEKRAAIITGSCKQGKTRSRVRPSMWSFVRIDQTCLGRSGGFAPVSFPLFHGTRLGAGVASLDPAWPYSSARLQRPRSMFHRIGIGIRLVFGPKRTSLTA